MLIPHFDQIKLVLQINQFREFLNNYQLILNRFYFLMTISSKYIFSQHLENGFGRLKMISSFDKRTTLHKIQNIDYIISYIHLTTETLVDSNSTY